MPTSSAADKGSCTRVESNTPENTTIRVFICKVKRERPEEERNDKKRLAKALSVPLRPKLKARHADQQLAETKPGTPLMVHRFHLFITMHYSR